VQGVFRDIEQAVAGGRQYSAPWPATIGVWKRKSFNKSRRPSGHTRFRFGRIENVAVSPFTSPGKAEDGTSAQSTVCDDWFGSVAAAVIVRHRRQYRQPLPRTLTIGLWRRAPGPWLAISALLGSKLAKLGRRVARQQCPCPPCRAASGRVVAVGTIAYRPVEYGIEGPHCDIYKANQRPGIRPILATVSGNQLVPLRQRCCRLEQSRSNHSQTDDIKRR
jgi:hypothetical protein